MQYPALIPAISDVTCSQHSQTELWIPNFMKLAIAAPTGLQPKPEMRWECEQVPFGYAIYRYVYDKICMYQGLCFGNRVSETSNPEISVPEVEPQSLRQHQSL